MNRNQRRDLEVLLEKRQTSVLQSLGSETAEIWATAERNTQWIKGKRVKMGGATGQARRMPSGNSGTWSFDCAMAARVGTGQVKLMAHRCASPLRIAHGQSVFAIPSNCVLE